MVDVKPRASSSQRSRDLRAYASSTQVRLLVGGVFLLMVVGTLLIAAVYGSTAAAGAFLCLLVAALPCVLIFLGLKAMDWVVNRRRNE
ncbi:MAG: hypothetical protein A2Z17_07475 [Gammaproteobacteria bacterium RBG_16_66_13]|nr:MAG: hypothetical protein A2Z17_07475 [Gammaproteobacteria bacterium RBG_16_66_13]